MFVTLSSVSSLLLAAAAVLFGWFSWRWFERSVFLILFLIPLYLIKIKIGWLPLTFLEILLLTLLIVWFIKKAKAKLRLGFLKELGIYEFWLPVLLILIGTGISTILSADLKVSLGIFKSWFVEPIIFGVILFDVLKTEAQFKKLLWALVFSGLAVALIGLFYLLAGQLTFDGRLRAFYLSPNHLAMYLAPAFLISVALFFIDKNRKRRYLLAYCMVFVAISLYATLSYSAWLAILTALVFFLFLLGKQLGDTNKKIIFTCMILLLLPSVLLFYSQLGGVKLDDLFHSERSSWQSRLMVWQAAWQIGCDHWLFGIGPGMFQKYYLDYQKYFPPYLEWAVPQPQNLFLAFWLQTGLLGLAGFIWLLINFFRHILNSHGRVRISRDRRPSEPRIQLVVVRGERYSHATKQPLVLALAAVMIYVLVHGLLDTTYWKNDLSLIFWAAIFLGYIASRRRDW